MSKVLYSLHAERVFGHEELLPDRTSERLSFSGATFDWEEVLGWYNGFVGKGVYAVEMTSGTGLKETFGPTLTHAKDSQRRARGRWLFAGCTTPAPSVPDDFSDTALQSEIDDLLQCIRDGGDYFNAAACTRLLTYLQELWEKRQAAYERDGG